MLSAIAVISVIAATAVASGCGSSDSTKPTSLQISATKQGRKPVLTVPADTDGAQLA